MAPLSVLTALRGSGSAPRVALALGLLGCAAGASSACSKKAAESTFLQATDLAKADATLPFDPNEVVDSGSFTDTLTFDAVAIQSFLAKTPYKRASFLETYQSNGIPAADAILRAATLYRINPLVLMVRAQVDQGLIGAQFYPFPPSRVEYVFGCGCPGGGLKCDPALAGFDRQVDCLARKLRTSLDEIAGSQQTAGNWGPGKPSLTLDDVKVTPKDDATAALYQYSPIVGLDTGGNWLVWNVWQNYTTFLEYSGPVGPIGGTGAWTGDPCTADAVCAAPGAFCAKNFPNGMCTVQCTKTCPTDTGRPDSFCADFGMLGGYCLPVCNLGVAASCREGYVCKPVFQFGAPPMTTQSGCVKKT